MATDSRGRRLRRSFTDEFRTGAVRLVTDEGKTVGQVARELDLTESARRTGVARARADRGTGQPGALTTAEREALTRLRRESRELRITRLCRWLGVSPSGCYASRVRPESPHATTDRRLRVLVRASHEASRWTDGSPRVVQDLVSQHIHVSRKRVIRLMQAEGLQGRVRRRDRSTTMSDHDQPVAATVLNQDFTAAAPNERWVADTTELTIGRSSTLCLAAVLDLCSRGVVGRAVSAANDRHLALKALERALKRRGPAAGLLHHADQGSPHASEDYQRVLEAHDIVGRMSRRGHGYDTAALESWFSTVKSALGDHFDSHGVAKEQWFDYIEVF